ncbi:MAG: preprotein translocase subunit SecG [Candidatus Marinimicrobia bacterium]|nr:preprotein translocase subunit SecG [Candidatus Neomarinimicrobiota bacterium]MCF7850540.1 preprotein translocase subunit SecG [Candidatus Neomarinimicrobiota bacterium]MCF7904114.1 preprotein translocase subunit SecG [Candidatus Neomarinimicrobiota bacterium]
MTFLYILLVIVSLLLMLVILMQSSKGGGLAGAFGGSSSSNALFGGAGAGNVLTKITGGLAIAFMVLILLIGILNKGGSADQTDFQRELQEDMIVPGTQFDATESSELQLPAETSSEATPSDASSEATTNDE